MLERDAIDLIKRDLWDLGIREGDVILVMAGVRDFKFPANIKENLEINYGQLLMDALLECISLDGTLLVMTFNSINLFRPSKSPSEIFSTETLPNTGSLAKAVLAHPEVIRSRHPSNSFAAIGTKAASILRFHDSFAFTFRVIEDLVNLEAKLLSIGCIDSSPGFSTVHLAQYHLGISQRSRLVGQFKKNYLDLDGNVRLFRKLDIPGCSMGFWKMYPNYRSEGILKEGLVAGVPAHHVRADLAYELDFATLKQNEEALKCNDSRCIDCNFLKRYPSNSISTMVRALLSEIYRRFSQLITSKYKNNN